MAPHLNSRVRQIIESVIALPFGFVQYESFLEMIHRQSKVSQVEIGDLKSEMAPHRKMGFMKSLSQPKKIRGDFACSF